MNKFDFIFGSKILTFNFFLFYLKTEECNSDVCSTTSCLNGGRCIATSPDKGICLCPLGYAGNHCEIGNFFILLILFIFLI